MHDPRNANVNEHYYRKTCNVLLGEISILLTFSFLKV
jgi:hypothetical protein